MDNAIEEREGVRYWRDSNGVPHKILGEVTLVVTTPIEVSDSAGATASWYKTVKVDPGTYTARLLADNIRTWGESIAYLQVDGLVTKCHTPSGFGGYYGYGNPGAREEGKPGSLTIRVGVKTGDETCRIIGNHFWQVPEGIEDSMEAFFTPDGES